MGDAEDRDEGVRVLPGATPGEEGERLDRRTLFLMVCREVWRDGEVDDRDNSLLNRLRKFLRLEKPVARKLGKIARTEYKKGKLEPGGALAPRELYRKVCERAFDDAVLDSHERDMLAGLAKLLDLTPDEAGEILDRAEDWAVKKRDAAGLHDSQTLRQTGDHEIRGKSAREIRVERRQSLEISAPLEEDWAQVQRPVTRPRTALEKLGGPLGIFFLTLTWGSMVLLTMLFVTPADEIQGVVERREVLREGARPEVATGLDFWVDGRRFRTRVPGLIRYVQPGDAVRLKVRKVAGRGFYLQEVRQVRESPRGYLYEDFGYSLSLALSTAFVMGGLIGFGFAVRRR